MDKLNSRPSASRISTAVSAMTNYNGDRSKAASHLHIHGQSLASLLGWARRLGCEFPDNGPASGKKVVSRSPGHEGLSDKDRANLRGLGREPQCEGFQQTQIGASVEDIEDAHFRYGGRLNIFLATKNFAAARALIDQAEREQAGEGDELEPFGDISLVDSGIDMRITNALEQKAGAIYLKDLLSVDSQQMLSWPNFGPGSMDSVLRSIIGLAIQRDQLRSIAEMRLKEMAGNNSHGR